MSKKYSFSDLRNNTDIVAAAVTPLCETKTDGIEDWLSNASTSTSATAHQLASEWDAMSREVSSAAAALGHLGGSVTSEAKAAASRENGKRGGRPKGKQS